MAGRRLDVKSVVPTIACVLLGAGLIGGVVACAGTTYSNMVQNRSTAVASIQNDYCDRYEVAILDYKDAVNKTHENIVVKDESPSDAQGGSMFLNSLEAAGIDIDRVVHIDAGTYVYLIEQGDTLTKLSAAFGYSVDALANHNDIRDVNLIYADSSLRIPGE